VGICCRHIQLCNWFTNRSYYIFLFKQTNKLLLQLALAFVVIQTAEIAFNLLNQVSPLLILSNYIYLRTFQPDQPATLSQLSLNIQVQGYAIGLVFFGFYCVLVGYVIYKSKFLPKIFGILYVFTGLCYLVNSFTMFLSRSFDNPLFVYLAVPIFMGELSFSIWLLIKGINTSKMKKKHTINTGHSLLINRKPELLIRALAVSVSVFN
jgi:hypothetical protein